MKANPYFILKPYCVNHLKVVQKIIDKNNLDIDEIYSVNDWANISRVIYKPTIKKEGYLFKIGLEGHIYLVNYFWGNNAILLFLKVKKRINPFYTFQLAKKAKTEIRSSLLGGPQGNDILVLMNLEKIKITNSSVLKSYGILGVKNTKTKNFFELGKEGLWDSYFFKYVHMPDSYKELMDELKILKELDIIDTKNKIPNEEFRKMIKFKTFIYK